MFASSWLRPISPRADLVPSSQPSRRGPVRLLSAALLSATALAVATSTAAANPPGNIDCPPGQTPVDGKCVEVGDPAPKGPTVKIDLARQNTDRAGTHVRGYSTATDTSRPMSVQFKIDGVLKSTATANVSRTDVGNHGFDLTVPSARDAGQVCVVATDPENNGRTTVCMGIDRIKQFDATSVSYDTAHDVIEDNEIVELDTVEQENGSTKDQTTTVSGSERLTDTSSWSDTQDLVVHADGKLSIPVVGELGIEVTDTSTFVQNGSTESTHKWSWEQPVVVPAESTLTTTIVITRSTLTVPYTLSGSYEYYSGAKAAGKLDGGTYHGVNNHKLEVHFDPGDASRSGAPQPKPLLLQRVS
jgi:hypothetical protein